MTRGAAAYQQTQVQGRTPLEMTVMLCDGALRFLVEAKAAHQQGNLVARGRSLNKALAILAEFQSTLNMQEGGEIAAELDRLYAYMGMRLLEVSTKKDATAIDEVHRLLATLRDGWAQIAAPALSMAAGA